MKLRLDVLTGSLAGTAVVHEHGDLTLGRAAECGVRFDPDTDTEVSRQHAVIRATPDGFVVEDHQSTNGTRVNGSAVARALLRPGDVVQLGPNGPRLAVTIEGDAVTQGGAVPQPTPPQAPQPPPVPPQQQFQQPYQPQQQQQPYQPPHQPAQQQQAQPAAQPFAPPYSGARSATMALRQQAANFGLYNPDRDKASDRGWLGMGVMLAMTAIGALGAFLMLLILVPQLGMGGAAFAVVVAFAPAPLYLGLWLWIDRYDPEPVWAMAGAFAWGAGVTVVCAILNDINSAIYRGMFGEQMAAALTPVLSAPWVEESGKGIALLLVMLLVRREFDGVIDGILYAGLIGLGFATVENVAYYGRVATAGGAQLFALTFIVRGLLNPFGHSVYTSMTGIGCGISRQSHKPIVRVAAPVLGWCGAVGLHALWNSNGILVTLTGLPELVGLLLVYCVIWVPVFLGFLGFVLYLAARESKLIREHLAFEVERGLLTAAQLDAVCSVRKRIGWTLGSLGDMRRLNARRRFLTAATKLAFCYWHVERAQAAHHSTISLPQVPRLRAEVQSLQPQV